MGIDPAPDGATPRLGALVGMGGVCPWGWGRIPDCRGRVIGGGLFFAGGYVQINTVNSKPTPTKELRMFTITYFHPRTRVLHTLTTPSRVVAIDAYGAMTRAGFRVRAWHRGALLGWRMSH